MGSGGIRRRKQAGIAAFDAYEAARLDKRRQADFVETELPGWRRSGIVVFLMLVAAMFCFLGLWTSASSRSYLVLNAALADFGVVLGMMCVALGVRVIWLRGQYSAFIRERGRFPTHEEAIAMHGRLYEWSVPLLRRSTTVVFWLGTIGNLVFVARIARRGASPIADVAPGELLGFICGAILIGFGCLIGAVYATKRGRPFGSRIHTLRHGR